MIDSLAGATIVTPDIDAAIAAYRDWLGYVAGPVGTVGFGLAERWGVPAAAHARMVVMHPESGEARFLRFIEGIPDADYRPMGPYGWLSAEIIVQDVESLADRLRHSQSPFRIIGEPEVLDFEFTDQIKAMQVAGPGGEVLYLTEVAAEIPGFDLPAAESFVGQLFIMVLGGPGIAECGRPYAEAGRETGPLIEARVEVLSHAHGLPADHRHKLATIALGERSLLELDEMPASAGPRKPSSIGLPSGIAMVSFHGRPRDGVREIRIGHAGEWMEILAPAEG